MNKPAFDDISYWHQKAEHLDALLKECHEVLNDNRSILTICYEVAAYKDMVDGGTNYEA
jgi:hypothetical protein|tara:strand:+ start:519 stop:695 length:177 start_codon:yes stop_codon:yes gene_type:complete